MRPPTRASRASAWARIASFGSTPYASKPMSSSATTSRPLPQPTSSTREPGTKVDSNSREIALRGFSTPCTAHSS